MLFLHSMRCFQCVSFFYIGGLIMEAEKCPFWGFTYYVTWTNFIVGLLWDLKSPQVALSRFKSKTIKSNLNKQ